MTNWQDPEVVYQCGRALVLLIHCTLSIYGWEWFCTLPHDFAILTGQLKLNAGSILYLLCRYTALIALCLSCRSVNVMHPGDVECTYWMRVVLGVAFTAVACASGLLYLRVVALSGNNRYVLWIMGAGYAAIWALVGIAIAKTEATYFGILYACAPTGLKRYNYNMIYPFLYDTLCLGMMLFYLIRLGRSGRLWLFLVQQGVIYAAGICAAYLFVILMVSLDLNDPMSSVGLMVILLSATLCATRMQRGLIEFVQVSYSAEGDSGARLSTNIAFMQGATINRIKNPMSVQSRTGRGSDYGPTDDVEAHGHIRWETDGAWIMTKKTSDPEAALPRQ